MNPDFDAYYNKISEQANLLRNAPAERQQGVDKIKTEQDYAGKTSAVDTATKALYEAQKRLDVLPENLKQRLSGRPVTQAQLDRRISSESDPLMNQAKNMAQSRAQTADSLSLVDKAVQDYIGTYNSDISTRAQGLGGEADALFKRYQSSESLAAEERDRAFQREMAAIEKAQAEADRLNQLRIAQLAYDMQYGGGATDNAQVAGDEYEMIKEPETGSFWGAVNKSLTTDANPVSAWKKSGLSNVPNVVQGKAPASIFFGQKPLTPAAIDMNKAEMIRKKVVDAGMTKAQFANSVRLAKNNPAAASQFRQASGGIDPNDSVSVNYILSLLK